MFAQVLTFVFSGLCNWPEISVTLYKKVLLVNKGKCPEQYNPNIQVCAAYFTDDCFLNLGERNAGVVHVSFGYKHTACKYVFSLKNMLQTIQTLALIAHKCRNGFMVLSSDCSLLYISSMIDCHNILYNLFCESYDILFCNNK